MNRRPLRVLARPGLSAKQNPYTALLYQGMRGLAEVTEWSLLRAATGRYDIVHIHWPESVFNHSLFEARATTEAMLVAIDRARGRGAKLVWTVHNLRAHGHLHPEPEAAFRARFFERLDGILCLTEAGREAAFEAYPELHDVPSAVVPHPHYRGMYPDAVDRAAARRTLGLGDAQRVWTFVGRIAAYKGLDTLVEVFAQTGDPDLRLVIAGNPLTPSDRIACERWAARDPRIVVRAEFLPDDALQTYLRAADRVVLPFRDILNSGSAILALSFDCPVLAPARGAIVDLQSRVGDGWVQTYTGELTPDLLEAPRPAPEARCEGLDALSPESVGEATVAAYRRFVG